MITVADSIFFADGEWWYRQRSGVRQRAKIRLCETCGSEFASFPSSVTKFCSPECRRITCRRCGVLIVQTGANSRYCSEECKIGKRTCEECGKEFLPSKNAQGRFCSPGCFYDHQCPIGTIRDRGDGSGYTIIKVPPETEGKRASGFRNRWMLTHRYVMQEKLGRVLGRREEVHHINGKRDDNRPENLELWKKSQPAGVRGVDYHCPGCRCHELPEDKQLLMMREALRRIANGKAERGKMIARDTLAAIAQNRLV